MEKENAVFRGGKSIILRLEIETQKMNFGQVASAIANVGGDLVAIDVIQTSRDFTIRDLTVLIVDTAQIDNIIQTVKDMNGVKLVNVSDRTFLLHLGGEIEISPKIPI